MSTTVFSKCSLRKVFSKDKSVTTTKSTSHTLSSTVNAFHPLMSSHTSVSGHCDRTLGALTSLENHTPFLSPSDKQAGGGSASKSSTVLPWRGPQVTQLRGHLVTHLAPRTD